MDSGQMHPRRKQQEDAHAQQESVGELESPRSRLPAQVLEACTLSNEEYEQLVAIVPNDIHGNLTSIGSMLHDLGICTACPYVRQPQGCKNGILCMNCHISHTRRRRYRPCKQKRDREKMRSARASQSGETPEVANIQTPAGPLPDTSAIECFAVHEHAGDSGVKVNESEDSDDAN